MHLLQLFDVIITQEKKQNQNHGTVLNHLDLALLPFLQIFSFFFSSFIFISSTKWNTLQNQVAAVSHWLAFCTLPESAAVPCEDWSTQRGSSCLSVSVRLPGGLSECVRNKRRLLHHLKAPFHRGIPSQSAKPYNCYGGAEAFLSLCSSTGFVADTLSFTLLLCLHSIELHRDACTARRAWHPVHQWWICTLQSPTKMTSLM